ncbi:hypothetical protein Tco_1471710 [Tanacetum coccineum]
MSSSSSHAIVTYTSMSNDDDVLSWGIPLMDAYESDPEAPEAALQSPDQAPLSPANAPIYPEYHAPSDDDLKPAEAQPLPVSVSPTTLSPNYLVYSEPVEEDPEEDPEEEPSEEEEEEELLALADSPLTRLYTDLQSEVEEDEVSSTPPSPTSHHHIIPLSQTGLYRARIFAASSYRFEIGESLAAAAARQSGSTLARGTKSRFMTALEEVKASVTDIATRHRQESEEFYVRHQDAQNDRAILRAHVSTLERERCYHHSMTIAAEQEAMHARQAWTHSMDCNRELQAEIRVLKGEVRDLQQRRRDDADRLTRYIQHDRARKDARDPERHDGPADACSSC